MNSNLGFLNDDDSDDESCNNAPTVRPSNFALPPPEQLYGGNYEAEPVFRSMLVALPASDARFGACNDDFMKTDEIMKTPNERYPSSINSKPWVWEITSLHSVPRYHPIDRNALELEGISLDTVGARISNFFRGNSITCSYHDDEPGRADCLTQGLLKFAVQLWQGKTNTKIIMEVQRRQGCCIEMQHLRSRLYHAVLHGEVETDGTGAMEPSIPSAYNARRSASDRLHNLGGASVGSLSYESFLAGMEKMQTEVSFPSPLDISSELLSSKLLDQQRLGLESLCTMTDPCKFFSKESDRISRVVLCGDQDGDTKLRENFERYFVGVELQVDAASTTRMSEDDDLLRYAEGQFHGANHLLALRVLSNALESISWQKEHQPAQPLGLDPASRFWEPVVKALVYNLEVATQRPIEAALSVKCIRLLQGLEPRAMAETTAHLLPHLENAYRFGRDHHLGLQQESKELIGRLELAH